MARAAPATEITIPLIEEQVDTGLAELLAGYQSPYPLTAEKKDEFMRRFSLFVNNPLPDFDHQYGKAFEARDEFNPTRLIYAVVCDLTLPYHRHQATIDLVDFAHPHLTTVLGAGKVFCSHVNESRHVIFFERPNGPRLSTVMKSRGKLHEHKVIDHILEPAAKALMALKEKKISHGNIHSGAFFMGAATVMAECVSMPCGMLAPYYYEPVERLMADPLAHGEATEKCDIYALAILVLKLMYGVDHVKSMPRAEFIEQVVRQGAYQVFTLPHTISETFQDFFRGALNDSPSERWGLEQLNLWLGGKRFNMIAPVAPKEGSRPLIFAAQEFFNRRLLAHAFHRNWREAIAVMKSLKLERWSEMSLHRPELTERLTRALRNGLERSATDVQANEMMTRIITILDPSGPLRTLNYSLRPDAIGFMLAEAFERNDPEINQLIALIEQNLIGFWSDQQDSNQTHGMAQVNWRIQRARTYLKRKSMGFGIERVLYELNPALHCQSPLLKNHVVMNVPDALKTLDALATTLAPTTSFIDRHLAAFIACKIDMGKEIKIVDLTLLPALARNPELIILRMLAKAQQSNPKMPLVGLSAWVGLRVEKMIDEIHNREIRRKLKLKLKKRAQSGDIGEVLGTLVNRAVLHHDHKGFSQAIALHQVNNERIERFRNMEILDKKSRRTGGKMAAIISNIVLSVMVYITLVDLLGIAP